MRSLNFPAPIRSVFECIVDLVVVSDQLLVPPPPRQVYEVCDRVSALFAEWPSSWGPRDEASVCVVSAYAEQVRWREDTGQVRSHQVIIIRQSG